MSTGTRVTWHCLLLVTMLTLMATFSTALYPKELAIENGITAVYENDIDTPFQSYITLLQREDGIPAIIAFINASVPFDKPVTLRIGVDDGPLFDPETNEIWLPLDFLAEIDRRFSSAQIVDTQPELDDVVLDVVMHTLLHEVAHVIIAQFNIPTLGKEEDAADNLANVLLLEYVTNGDVIALNAADMFALEDQADDEFENADFWDEHSLDIQRYYTTVCHVYGAYPEEHSARIDAAELSVERAEACIEEYLTISHDWLSVLEGLTN